MQEVSVNSTTIKVYPPRKNDHPLFWKNPIEEHNDLLDLLKDRITAQVEFDANAQRFGDGTAADTTPQDIPESQTHPSTNAKKVRLIPFDGGFHRGESVVYGVERNGNTELYRYIFFTITYGENGMRAELHQPTGDIQVHPEDILSQRFHVFIAFVSHPGTTTAIMLTEALGRRSVADVMRKWLKRLLKSIDGKNHTVDPVETPDSEALKTFIERNRWEEVRIAKKAVADENGLLPDYSEEVRIFKFSKNRPQAPLRMIRDVFHRAFPHDTEAVEHSPELDGFDPEKIQFKVKGPRGSRIFTVNKLLSGGIREVLDPSVVGADGYTSDAKMLEEFKRIFEDHHMPQ